MKLSIIYYLCMLKMMLETFALSFFWKYFLSPDRAVMAAILISRYKIGTNKAKKCYRSLAFCNKE